VLAALLTWLCFALVFSASRESPTADEPTELAAGYSYLKTGDFRMNPEHPPLMKMLAALPLLRFGIHSPFNSEEWQKVEEYPFSTQFFDENAPKEDAILFAARLTSIALTLAFALAIALWTRVVFGPYVAIVALTLFVFDPTIIANGHYVKNDVAVALFAFLSCITWAEYLKVPTLRRLFLSGLCLGAALATKFSALFYSPRS
jgi:dolichyl-phosphate-mannose--protein O-mannosyl transferase